MPYIYPIFLLLFLLVTTRLIYLETGKIPGKDENECYLIAQKKLNKKYKILYEIRKKKKIHEEMVAKLEKKKRRKYESNI